MRERTLIGAESDFSRASTQTGELLELANIELEAISTQAIEIAEKLWNASEKLGFVSRRVDIAGQDVYEQTRHFRSVFCTAADCQQLRVLRFAALNAQDHRVTRHFNCSTERITIDKHETNQKLELTWIGEENRANLEPRVLLEDVEVLPQ